jgi:hypothetical protein
MIKKKFLNNFKSFNFLKKKIENTLLDKKKKLKLFNFFFNLKKKFIIFIFPVYSSKTIFFKIKGNIVRFKNQKNLNSTIKIEGLISKNRYFVNYNPYSLYLYTV